MDKKDEKTPAPSAVRDALIAGCEKAGGEFIAVNRKQLLEALKAK